MTKPRPYSKELEMGEVVDAILQKYEVPYQFGMALWDAYEAGAKEGFKRALEAGIQTINEPELRSAHTAEIKRLKEDK